MADFVQAQPLLRRLQIREVDASNVGGRLDPRRSEILLTSRNGCALHWGRVPTAEHFGEISAEEKLENLREILAVYPHLEGLRYVKLHFKGAKAVGLVDDRMTRPR
jgi:hypothetical protein